MPFCPECSSAFKEGTAECPECKVALVTKLVEGETDDFVEVFRAQSLMEAESIESALKENGIETFLRNTGIPAMPMMGEEGAIVIEVRADQAAEAKDIITELEETPPPEIDENAGGDGKKS
ncbi:MAG: DUF2007 domain-containing protein [Deltaproteobacteria bacterium]|nr:DUF2007 domain-containing protein [Deltaproteobacteria bacterium]